MSNRKKRAQARKKKLPIVPIVLGLVALAAVIAVIASGGGGDGDSDTATVDARGSDTTTADGRGSPGEIQLVEATGTPLSPFQGQDGDPAVGRPAPELSGFDFEGEPLAIRNDGRPKVLVFLAHWCPHCQEEVPKLVDFLADNPVDDVDLYGVATNTSQDRPNYPPSEWLRREGWRVPTLADAERATAATAYGLSSFPYFVAVDAQGEVVVRASGELSTGAFERLLDLARRG